MFDFEGEASSKAQAKAEDRERELERKAAINGAGLDLCRKATAYFKTKNFDVSISKVEDIVNIRTSHFGSFDVIVMGPDLFRVVIFRTGETVFDHPPGSGTVMSKSELTRYLIDWADGDL